MSSSRLAVRIERGADDRWDVMVQEASDLSNVSTVATGSFGTNELPQRPPIAVGGPRAQELQLAKAGHDLFELLMRAGLKEVWPGQGPAPQVLVDLRHPDLARWPWELLEDRRTGRLFTSRTRPAARAHLPFQNSPKPAAVPLRVLVVVGDPTDPNLRPDAEIEAIYQGLAEVPCIWHVEVVRRPEKDTLFADYPELAPDVLHVIGHGVSTPRGPAIQMNPASGPWNLSAQYLVQTLAGTMPRLVVLNACRSADQTHEALELARGLVDGLLDNGVLATVAMQGDVSSEPAATFARELYRQLARRRALDAAVAEARAVVGNTMGFDDRDWALPVLDLRADPARVLRQRLAADPLDVIKAHHGFSMVSRMVDRAPQRRELHDGRPRARAADKPGGLVFVTGDSKVGKTILARSCVVSHRVSGASVVYYSLEGRGTVSTGDFLLNLVDAARRWFGDAADARCATTKQVLAGRFADGGDEPRVWRSPLPVDDDFARPNAPVSAAAAGYSMVTQLLVELGRRRPVTLVLDHLGLVEDKNALVSELLRPASERKLGKLQVVVVEQQAALVGIAGVRGVLPISPDIEIPIAAFQREDACELMREYLARSVPAAIDKQKWDDIRSGAIMWATQRMTDGVTMLTPSEIEGEVAQQMRKHWPAGLVTT